jgi:hypothetical protein
MREGRPKRREGRPRKSKDRSKRRTSQRLADKRRRPDAENLEAGKLFDPGVEYGFGPLENAMPLENNINVSTENHTSQPSVASSGDESAHRVSNEINSTADSISSSPFDFRNSQSLSQCSNTSSLVDKTWILSENISDPTSMSGMLYPGTNIVGDRWIGTLQQDTCDGSSMSFEWQDDPLSFNESHYLSGFEEHWNESDIFALYSHEPFKQAIIHDPTKSASAIGDSSVDF